MKRKILSTLAATSILLFTGASASAATLHKGTPSSIHGSWVSTKGYTNGPRVNEKYRINFTSSDYLQFDYPAEADPSAMTKVHYKYTGKNRYKITGKKISQGQVSINESMDVHLLSKNRMRLSFHSTSTLPGSWSTIMKRN